MSSIEVWGLCSVLGVCLLVAFLIAFITAPGTSGSGHNRSGGSSGFGSFGDSDGCGGDGGSCGGDGGD